MSIDAEKQANRAQSAIDLLQDRLDWQAAEIERLKAVCAEQDRRAQTVTARGEIVMGGGGPTFIVTCPAGDEEHLMRAVFAGFAASVWTSLSMSFEAMWPGASIKDAADRLFARKRDGA